MLARVVYPSQARRIYPTAKQWGLDIPLVFLGLLPNVFINGCFGNADTDTPDEITSDPDLATPVLATQPRELFEQLLGRETLKYLHRPSGSNPRGRAEHQMNMVRQYLEARNLEVVGRSDGLKNHLDPILGVVFSPDVLTVLSSPRQVVPQTVASMTGFSNVHTLQFTLQDIFQAIALTPSDSRVPSTRACRGNVKGCW